VYVSAPDDPTVAPDGHEAWSVLVNAAPQGRVDWREPGLSDGYADHVLAVLAGRGLDVRDRVLFRRVLTPADLQDQTWTPGGPTHGRRGAGWGGLLRPPTLGPVAALPLAGGSAQPGGGLPLAALPAEIVAPAIGPS